MSVTARFHPLLLIAIVATTNAMPPIGDYKGPYAVAANLVTIPCAGNHAVRLLFCKPDLIRVDIDTAGKFSPKPIDESLFFNIPDQYKTMDKRAVDHDLLLAPFNQRTWPATSFTHSDEGTFLQFQTLAVTVKVIKAPFQIQYYRRNDGGLILKDSVPTYWRDKNLVATFSRSSDEKVFGLGSEFHLLRANVNGGNSRASSTFNSGSTNLLEKSSTDIPRTTIPFMYSTRGYGLFFLMNNPYGGAPSSKGFVDFRDAGVMSFYDNAQTTGYYTSYYFMHGPEWRLLTRREESLPVVKVLARAALNSRWPRLQVLFF